ncbi:MAG: hypothetical protein ACRDN0_35935 [Trebonia sp.]
MLAGVGHHVGGPAVGACGLAVPHRVQLVRLVHHVLAGGHVGLGRGLGERQAADAVGLGEQGVVPGMRLCREPGAVPGGRDDDFEGAAEIGDGAGEDLVGPVGQAGQAGHAGRALGERRAESLVNQARGRTGQAPVP